MDVGLFLRVSACSGLWSHWPGQQGLPFFSLAPTPARVQLSPGEGLPATSDHEYFSTLISFSRFPVGDVSGACLEQGQRAACHLVPDTENPLVNNKSPRGGPGLGRGQRSPSTRRGEREEPSGGCAGPARRTVADGDPIAIKSYASSRAAWPPAPGPRGTEQGTRWTWCHL